jgi:hypothetical protein
MQRKKTTSEIVPKIGISHQALITYLARHSELKPAERLPNGDYLWSDEEVERVVYSRTKRRRITQKRG